VYGDDEYNKGFVLKAGRSQLCLTRARVNSVYARVSRKAEMKGSKQTVVFNLEVKTHYATAA
jgi:hypothetical protein